MAVSLTRRSSDARQVAEQTLATRADARRVLRRFLARAAIGVFLVVLVLGAILNMGSPSWLLTVSGIAALPRIVTLDEMKITRENKDVYDNLSFELTAKTYRYLDDAEVAAVEKSKVTPPAAGS